MSYILFSNGKHFQILSDWTILLFFAEGMAFLCMVSKRSAKQDGKIMTLLFSLLVKQWMTVFSWTKHNKICVSKSFLLCIIWKLKSRHLLQWQHLYLVGCLLILKCFQKCKIKSFPPLKKSPDPHLFLKCYWAYLVSLDLYYTCSLIMVSFMEGFVMLTNLNLCLNLPFKHF